MKSNIDRKTIDSFGEEWTKYNQSDLSPEEAENIFDKYFHIFPWEILSKTAVGFDLGCGTGRWAKIVAPKVGHLNCIDPSSALEVAKKSLSSFSNTSFFQKSVDEMPLEKESQDFGYSLGVLHHVPDTQAAIEDCSKVLKKGAPFLLYIYYDFDNRSKLYKFIWKLSNLLRIIISRFPKGMKFLITDLLAVIIYFPLARFSLLAERLGFKTESIPLSFYKDCSLYTMRTDSRDRFGTPLERRFTKLQINKMLIRAGFEEIVYSDAEPYWCVVAKKRSK